MRKRKLGTKAAFVRKLPIDMPTAEVIARGKAFGVTDYDVYSTRATMRKQAARQRRLESAAVHEDIPRMSHVGTPRMRTQRPASPPQTDAIAQSRAEMDSLGLRTLRMRPDLEPHNEDKVKQLRVLALAIGLDRAQRELDIMHRAVLEFGGNIATAAE